jgi:glycosyltransferase involved in cell wall biosynthesis
VRALRRFVTSAAYLPPEATKCAPTPSSTWTAAVICLVTEFRQTIDQNFALPSRIGRSASELGNRKRILYVSQHDPALASNGYARRTREITRELDAAGYDVMVAVSSRSLGSAENEEWYDGRIRYRQLARGDNRAEGLSTYIGALAEAIRNAACSHKAGLIHSASNYLNGLASISAARSLGIPCVYELRGLWEETRCTVDPSFRSSIGYKLQARMETFCAENADATVIGSTGIAEELRRRGANTDRFFLAESGGPDTDIDAIKVADGRFAAFPAGSRVLGFVGSITCYEGFSTIAKALSLLLRHDPRYRMLIVGGGPFETEARRLFKRAGVASNVVFAGVQPFDSAIEAYRQIDLAVYPRDSMRVTEIVESLKPIEALAAGVPVVISDVLPNANIRESCRSAFTVRASNSRDLANKVEEFFALSKEERQSLGVAGREWVMTSRRWLHTVKSIESAHTSIP